MRLTVRTLLAYLDNVLDQEDSDALAAKLEESPFAKSLADRIRASVGDPASGSPPVHAAHPIEDANTVAEYLDNVLEAQHIPEVEKILIESKTHLSEVAACHQILTLVLSRPANVPHNLREKLYRFAGQVRQAEINAQAAGATLPVTPLPAPNTPAAPNVGGQVSANAVTSVPQNGNALGTAANPSPFPANGHAAADSPVRPMSATPPVAASKRHDIPEYLRAGRPGRILPWIISACLCAALLFILGQAFKPAISRFSDDKVIADSGQAGASDELAPAVGEDPLVEEILEEEAEVEPSASETAETTGPSEPGVARVKPAEATAEPAATESVVSEIVPASSPDLPVSKPETPSDEGEGVAMPAAVANAEAGEAMVADIDSETSPIELLEHEEVGTYKSIESLLVRKMPVEGSEDSEKNIARVKSDTPVLSYYWYANMPTFRNEFALHGGVSMAVVDSADFTFVPVAGSTPKIVLDYGGIVLSTATPADSIILKLTGREAKLTFTSLDATASVRVKAFRAPGRDPEQNASIISLVEVRSLSGEVNFEVADAEPVKLAPGTRWTKAGDAVANVEASAAPAWTIPTPASQASIEETSRRGLLSLDESSKTIDVVLREAVGFRRSEVAALAARCLLHLGMPDIYFGTDGILNKDEQKSHWQSHFNDLQSHLNRGGDYTMAIKNAIKEMNAAEAIPLYQLLWGRSQAQLETGGDFELVETLGSNSMPIRVLGIENLRQITGTNLYYRPQDIASRRGTAVKKWETRLQKKDIRWSSEPKPLDQL